VISDADESYEFTKLIWPKHHSGLLWGPRRKIGMPCSSSSSLKAFVKKKEKKKKKKEAFVRP
jgi:hypothetical protein